MLSHESGPVAPPLMLQEVEPGLATWSNGGFSGQSGAA